MKLFCNSSSRKGANYTFHQLSDSLVIQSLRSMTQRTRTRIRRSQQFSALLSSAILEWVLMFLLLLEGLLSYLGTTFARLCKLQAPCPMCTRLDHVLGKAHPGFYRDLMCKSHKAEASSWAFCHIHQNLVDVHSMCEACLLSFATENKTNLETYRSLVGKLGVGIGNGDFVYDLNLSCASEAHAMKEDDALCSCCSSPLKIRSYPSVVLLRKDSGIGESCRDVSTDQCIDEINYAAYSELKTSDSESEPRQCGGNVRSLMEDTTVTGNFKEDFTLGHAQTNIASSNVQEKVVRHPELTPILNGGSGKKPSVDSRELHSIQGNVSANSQSTDLPRKNDQPITEDSDIKDKPEDDVWHNALSSTELPDSDDAKSAETNTASNERKPEFSDKTTRNDSFRVHQDLKRLLSQLSTSQPPDSPTGFADSPSAHEQDEQAILRNISRALSLERSYSGISESTMNLEAEREYGTIDQLKQQVELDRKSISLLWKELEEERNASAVAANQTMAMITRLQEEKAAMQMEALQYRRIMEEQSEYDREDLQRMAGTVQSLEAEVESYKMKLRDQSFADEIRDQMRLSFPKEPEVSISRSTGPFRGLEDENAFISKQLRKLTNKLHQFSNNSQFIQEPRPAEEEEDAAGDTNNNDDVHGEEEEEDAAAATRGSVVGRRVRNGNSFTRWQRLQSIGTHGKVDDHHDQVGEISDMAASLEDEISELGTRLQALEADRSFLQHSVNSLRNGREGEEVIHDIACSLRELRKTGVSLRKGV